MFSERNQLIQLRTHSYTDISCTLFPFVTSLITFNYFCDIIFYHSMKQTFSYPFDMAIRDIAEEFYCNV
jgi:hypothetical protein